MLSTDKAIDNIESISPEDRAMLAHYYADRGIDETFRSIRETQKKLADSGVATRIRCNDDSMEVVVVDIQLAAESWNRRATRLKKEGGPE